ncbi:bifunctional YEATS/YEATS superfamily [Babesia duncani]|uniref:Bifunctional YEATS/YEATS superfamily n=1 Tax=Babesia duncani TaxID=323732 RepID=A0AAD9PKJ7_9APIC|nr:bifunctional YEATS/YEATS superfamily [Babesia duncani]
MSNNKRLNLKIGKRIVVGTYAFPLNQLEKKRYGSMTHRWVCLLRSLDNENMTHYVKRVQFDLDPSFLNPKRVISTMPYEINEVGWGEFFIGVKIFFVDESLEPMQLQHLLRLHAADNSTIPTNAVNETHDEIIFNEPYAWFYEKLLCSSNDKLPPNQYKEYFWETEVLEREAMSRYVCCQSYFQNETYRLLSEATALCKQIQYLQERYMLNPPKLNQRHGKERHVHKLTDSTHSQSPSHSSKHTQGSEELNKSDETSKEESKPSYESAHSTPKRQLLSQKSPKTLRSNSKLTNEDLLDNGTEVEIIA